MKKKLTGITALLLVLTMVLGGCAQGKQQSATTDGETKQEQKQEETKKAEKEVPKKVEPTKIKFLGWTEQKQDAMEKMITAFEQANEDVKVELELLDPKQYGDIVMARLSAGEAADVMAVALDKMKQYGEAGYLRPFDKSAPILNQFKDGILDKATYNGDLLMLPAASDSFGLFYNKDLFKSLGIEAPKSYPEFKGICDKILESKMTPIAMPGKETWAPQFLVLGLWGEVGEKYPSFFTDAKAGKVTYAEYPEYIHAIERFAELVPYYSENALGIDWNNAQRQFYTGEAAMIASGTWMLSDVRKANPDFEVGFMSIPYSEEEQDVFNTHGGYTFCVSIPSESKNTDEAMRFVDFMFGKHYKEYLNDTQFAGSTIKGVVPGFDPILKEFDATFTSTSERVYEPSVQNVFFRGFQEIIQGTKTPEEIVKAMDEEQKRIMEQ